MNSLIVTAADVNPDELRAFLLRFYPRAKCDFLRAHGKWRHGSDQNRWVMFVDGQIAGYCALIPTRVLFHGEIMPAVWWVDLIIAPEYRGMGLQSLFDKKIQELDILRLGIPNLLASKIHLKHGWKVRDDLQTLLLPLHPLDVNQVCSSSGWHGRGLKFAASVMIPWAWITRQRLSRYQPQAARQLDNPSPEILAGIFSRFVHGNIFTTYRDVHYFRQRFFNAPYQNELTFYVGGNTDVPTHFLITRHLKRNNGFVTRILDLFGDFKNKKNTKDIVLLALRDAVTRGSSQVTILSTQSKLRSLLFNQGFFFKSPSRFCWLIRSEHLIELSKEQIHWTLADSDNDEMV
jgi:hypothetical protein